jgi:hypothetical protein
MIASGYPLPSRIQANFEQVFMNPMSIDLSRLSYQSQITFATNIGPQYGHNTFEGSAVPSFSCNGTAMTTDAYQESTLDQTAQLPGAFTTSTFEFPQSSTDVLYSPQPPSADQDLPVLHEQPSFNSQRNRTFDDFH